MSWPVPDSPCCSIVHVKSMATSNLQAKSFLRGHLISCGRSPTCGLAASILSRAPCRTTVIAGRRHGVIASRSLPWPRCEPLSWCSLWQQ
jgi:hypothetical protein